jgi:C_GCAxxG_C_C family probable redox protein
MMQLTEKEILDQFGKGIDCSQIVMASAAKDIGIDEITAKKVSSCFGAGMMCGETCGAVTGALMAVGLKYGHYIENDKDQKDIMISKSSEFKEKFLEKYSSFMCKDLLGYNVSIPEEMEEIIKKELLTNFCPKVVENVIGILKEVL